MTEGTTTVATPADEVVRPVQSNETARAAVDTVRIQPKLPASGEGRQAIEAKAVNTGPTTEFQGEVETGPPEETIVQQVQREAAAAQPAETNLTKMQAWLTSANIPLTSLTPETQTLFNELNDATRRAGEDPEQFTNKFKTLLEKISAEIKMQKPDAAKHFDKMKQAIDSGKFKPQEVWDELTMAAKAQDPEAAKNLEEIKEAVAKIQQEGKNPDGNFLKKINFARLTKIFGIGIIAILALLLFQGISSSGALAGSR